MKTLTTMTAAVALIAGMSFASAQNAATPHTNTPPPSSINAGAQTSTDGSKSGSQMNASGSMKASGKKMGSAANVIGKSKFCITEAAGSNNLNCKYATMAACNKEAQQLQKSCQQNPKMAGAGMKSTTGMKAK